MVIIKENKLSEGASDIRGIQKRVLEVIVNFAKRDSSMKAQKSSPQKVFIGCTLGALQGAAQALNPMGNAWPFSVESQRLQNDVVVVYKQILKSIAELEKIYVTDYKDDLW